MPKDATASPVRRIIKRSIAAQILGLCVRTLERRERADPRFPARLGLGINGGPPWGYAADDLDKYVAGLPRVRAPVADRQGAATRGVADASGADTPGCTPGTSAVPATSKKKQRPGSGSKTGARHAKPDA